MTRIGGCDLITYCKSSAPSIRKNINFVYAIQRCKRQEKKDAFYRSEKREQVHIAHGVRLNIQASLCIFSPKSATTCPKMRYSKIHQMSLPSAQVHSKPYSIIKLLMVMCQKAPPLLFKAFPRWNYQPDVWQNDGAIRGSITRTSPGPLCAEDDFLASVITTLRPTTISATLKGAYRLPLSSRMRPVFCYLDCILLL